MNPTVDQESDLWIGLDGVSVRLQGRSKFGQPGISQIPSGKRRRHGSGPGAPDQDYASVSDRFRRRRSLLGISWRDESHRLKHAAQGDRLDRPAAAVRRRSR